MQENKKKEREANKILRELGIQTATTPISSPTSENWRYNPPDPIKKQWEETGGWGFGVEKSGQGYFVPLPLVQKEKVKDLFIAQNDSTGGMLGPDAKRRLLDEEYQKDVIKQVLDGTMSSSDGAQILQMEENEFEKLMNSLKPNEGTSDDKVKDLLIAPYNDTNWR